MVILLVLLRFVEWVWYHVIINTCYVAARKMRSFVFHLVDLLSNPLQQPTSFPSILNCDLEGRESQNLACDIHKVLLRTNSFFPYFMLVCFEGGSIFRAFFLLCSCPILWFLSYELKLRVMIFISFCGLKTKDMEMTARAVLPKFYSENLNLQVYEVVVSVGSRVFSTYVPRVMVEGFLKEYLNADDVVATELHTVGCYFTGLLSMSGLLVKHSALKDYFGDRIPDIGIGSTSILDHHFISYCKEPYVVNNEKCPGSIMPRDKYPKPLIFHDGRLAFLPTPSATLYMFMWLPIGLLLAIYRILLGFFLSCKWIFTLATWSGVVINVKGWDLDCLQSKIPTVTQSGKSAPFILDQIDDIVNSSNQSLPSILGQRSRSQLLTAVNPFPKCGHPQISEPNKGVLYVCTHRTLLDPVFLSLCLGKPLTTVTYSLSKVSELISPIRTMRLTRDRKQDRDTMQRLLSEGDLVVCPEGTTCREPYLLRFSSLFAELADEIVPVAIHSDVSLFYGTTARGLKCLDPFVFLMNPRPCYNIEILGKVPNELTCAGGRSPCEVANYIQKQLGSALGFECTNITRRDKYLMLAGNEGVVQEKKM